MDYNDEENIEWLMESSKTVEELEENDVDFEQKEDESIELCRFLNVLRTSFEDEPILFEDKARGTVKCEEDVQKLMKRLKAMGFFFSVRTSGRKVDRLNRLMVINMNFPPSRHPYRVLSHTYYNCSQRSREAEEMGSEHFMAANSSFPKCKAMVEVRQIEIFTTVSVPISSRRRVEVLRKFRRKLMRNPSIVGNINYEVVVSLPKAHNHAYNFSGKHLNEEVRAALYYILHTGTTSVGGIQEKLYEIVDREFENEAIKPSRDNKAFYPTQRTIYCHLRRDGIKLRRIRKKNLKKLLELKMRSRERRAKKLMELKDRTRELLNSLAEKMESCSDLELGFKLYSKIKYVESCFEGVDMMMTQDELERERETYAIDSNTS